MSLRESLALIAASSASRNRSVAASNYSLASSRALAASCACSAAGTAPALREAASVFAFRAASRMRSSVCLSSATSASSSSPASLLSPLLFDRAAGEADPAAERESSREQEGLSLSDDGRLGDCEAWCRFFCWCWRASGGGLDPERHDPPDRCEPADCLDAELEALG